jgi:hypothetical protein
MQMYSAAKAFNTLATGDAITPQSIKNVATSFKIEQLEDVDFGKDYSHFIDQANLVWAMFFPQLEQVDQIKLWKTWVLILSQAAEEVAKEYTGTF